MKRKPPAKTNKLINPVLLAILVLFSAMIDARITLLIAISMVAWVLYQTVFVEKKTKRLIQYAKAMILALIIAAAVTFALRSVKSEDSWDCKDGAWIRHGAPSLPKPTTPCK